MGLKLRAESGADHATFQCENTAEDEVSEFDLKLMQIESEHMEIPEQQYQVVAKMPSAKFLKIVKEPVVATFALAYLVKFAKAAPLCDQVELGVGAEMPISVKYELDGSGSDNGHMQFHLAPKVED